MVAQALTVVGRHLPVQRELSRSSGEVASAPHSLRQLTSEVQNALQRLDPGNVNPASVHLYRSDSELHASWFARPTGLFRLSSRHVKSVGPVNASNPEALARSILRGQRRDEIYDLLLKRIGRPVDGWMSYSFQGDSVRAGVVSVQVGQDAARGTLPFDESDSSAAIAERLADQFFSAPT